LLGISSVANATVTFGTGLAHGDSMRKSLISAAMNVGLSAIPLNAKLKKMALPLAVKLEPEAIKLTARVAGALAVSTAASMAGDALTSHVADAADKAANRTKSTGAAQAKTPAHLEHLVGIATQVAHCQTNGDYVTRTAFCPANYSSAG
jgi:hypothetical protein